MSAYGPYLRKSSDRYMFWCQACDEAHSVGFNWQFNNNPDSPTFIPSILVTYIDGDPSKRCHSYITNGKIQYLLDCSHSMANTTVDLISWPTDWVITGE